MAETDQRPDPPHANGRRENGLGERGAEFDRDLYAADGDRFAGLDTSIGVADDEQDFRERAMARCLGHAHEALDIFPAVSTS